MWFAIEVDRTFYNDVSEGDRLVRSSGKWGVDS